MTTKQFIEYLSTGDGVSVMRKDFTFIERESFNVRNISEQSKLEIIAEYFDKYSYEELKKRLE